MEELLIPNRKLLSVHIPLSAASRNFDLILDNLENTSTESIIDCSQSIHYLLTLMIKETLTAQSGSGDNRRRIQKVADYIQANYTEDIDVDTLADLAHLSKSYFLQQFRQYKGTTPYNYLLSCRITKAKELLELTDQSILEISEQLGFRDQSAFSVRFSRMTGESPLHYRKNSVTRNQSI